MNSKFNFITLYSELFKKEEVSKILLKYANTLKAVGGEFLDPDDGLDVKTLVYFIIGGGTEQQVLDLLAKRRLIQPFEPVYLIAHSSSNSLAASMEILARLQQEGVKGKIVYLSGNEQSDINLLRTSIRNLKVYKKLHNTKLGLIGKPSEWLVASSPQLDQVKEKWGVNISQHEMEEVTEYFSSISDSEIQTESKTFSDEATEILEPSKNDLDSSSKIYLAIKKLTEKHELDSVSVRCFDLLKNEKATGCFALSQLTDKGIIAGCEGDIVTTIAMLWVNLMFEKTPWMANPSRIDINENRLILAHCTVPKNLVSEYGIRSHFESGIGVGIQGKIVTGPVTLIRLGGSDMKSIWLAEGEIIENHNDENLCRTQVELRLHDRNKLKSMLNNPLGNHLVLIHGFHADELDEWHQEFIR